MARPPSTRPRAPAPGQGSFDDLGTPLSDVTFCVVDLETTGTSAADCAITEVGAVKLRGGECLGTFQTLVDPGTGIPPSITVLTGITEAMVVDAPPIGAVIPSLLEFMGDAVVVGHNVRFDVSFLRAALEMTGHPPLANRSVDTCGLARRLLRGEVPDCRLGTLATHLRLDHQPSHRALDDALATGDLLHLLLDRAGALGVTGLDDLLTLPRMAGHAQASKLRLTEDLPRGPGVYLFRGRRGEVLYVGRASDLRTRVRSYFSSDTRRKTARLLAETVRIDHRRCASPLEAAVAEIRLIHQHEPRFNRQGTTWRRYAYVKLSLGERFPRLSAARVVRDDGGLYLGPVPSTSSARRIIEAIETVVPLRRCTGRSGRTPRSGPCVPAQLGVSTCPCTGEVTEADYAAIVDVARSGLTDRPGLLLEPLADRMAQFSRQERFEEAAEVRDRAATLATALDRRDRIDGLRGSGLLRLVVDGTSTAEFHHGRLVDCGPTGDPQTRLPTDPSPDAVPNGLPAGMPGGIPGTAPDIAPVSRELADELHCVASWLRRDAHRIVVDHCDGTIAERVTRHATFRTGPDQRRDR